jgi:hypothetical protein
MATPAADERSPPSNNMQPTNSAIRHHFSLCGVGGGVDPLVVVLLSCVVEWPRVAIHNRHRYEACLGKSTPETLTVMLQVLLPVCCHTSVSS